MQYLYYGGPESLLIKNNEIMEVRHLSFCLVGGISVNSGRRHVLAVSGGGPVLGFHLGAGFGVLPASLDLPRTSQQSPFPEGRGAC